MDFYVDLPKAGFTFILNLFCYPLSTNPFPVTFQHRTSHEWLPVLLKNTETDMEAIYLPGELKEKFWKRLRDLFEYKVLFLKSVLCSCGSFLIKPFTGGTIFIAMLPFLSGGPLSRASGKKIEYIRLYMQEKEKIWRLFRKTEGRCALKGVIYNKKT